MYPGTHSITTLFLDIGGVLLTNGWDRQARQLAAERYQLDYREFDQRHHLTFDTYEEGKLSLDDYLDRVVFFEETRFFPGKCSRRSCSRVRSPVKTCSPSCAR